VNFDNKEFCTKTFLTNFSKFMGNYNIEKLKLVVGHCPQYESTIWNKKNITMSKLHTSDSISLTYSNEELHKGQADNTDFGKIFGITMQCEKPNKNDFYIYQIDIGSSRGFDNNIEDIIINDKDLIEKENKYLFSKTPQILHIDNNDKVFIIKSKIGNTRKQLPRPNYEKLINASPDYKDLKLDEERYAKKYLKYKQKYLKLKNII